MKKVFLITLSIVVLLLTACHNSKPKPFLNDKQMCDLLTEIRLTEAVLYNHRTAEASVSPNEMTQYAGDVYAALFQKYGINYNQYMALMNYYMGKPQRLTAIYEKSAENLNRMLEEKRVADSAASVAGAAAVAPLSE